MAYPPTPDFKFPHDGSKQKKAQTSVKRPLKPRLNFDHRVTSFIRQFPQGFDGQHFHLAERGYKEQASTTLKEKLGTDTFERLLHEGRHAEVCEIAKLVLRGTNLVYPVEKAKFVDGVENAAFKQRFATTLFNLLHGSAEMEQRFVNFCNLLSEMGANKWPIATYFQFLHSDGKWMFIKPAIMKSMADSLNVSLNYKAEPNWLTYSKLQELADRVDSELRNRGLSPHSRMDVQGFIWSSISIEEGSYRKD